VIAVAASFVPVAFPPPLAPVAASEPAYTGPYPNDVRLRRSLGLRADVGYVASLYRAGRAGDPEVVNSGLGIVLTRAEVAELDLRDRLVDEDRLVAQEWLRAQPTSLTGGVALDNRDGGHLAVLVTRDVERVRRELLRRVPHPERLEVRHVRWSHGQLREFEGRIGVVPGPGFVPVRAHGSGIDILANVVRVLVAPEDVERARRVLPLFVPPGAVVIEAGDPPVGV
jgi:hypothetical protein